MRTRWYALVGQALLDAAERYQQCRPDVQAGIGASAGGVTGSAR